MKIETIEIRPITLPLRNSFCTALGEKRVTRNVLFILKCSDGIQGIGEASTSLAMPEATQKSIFNLLSFAKQTLLNQPISNWRKTCQSLKDRFPNHPTAISAIECAFLDADCRSKKIPLSQFFGRRNEKVETTFTIPALKLKNCKTILERMMRKGFKKFKVKVTGKSFSEDFGRVTLVKEMVKNSSIIVDANQAWTKKTSLKFIEKSNSKNLPIIFVEQPLPRRDIEGLKFIRNRSPIPIAVDESLRTFQDARKIVEEGAADIFNIKIAKIGLLESLKIVQYLKRLRRILMIGCMMESKIGLATSVHWACGTEDFSYVDLDSFLLLKESGIESGFKNDGPFLFLQKNVVGSGVTHKTLP